MYGHVFIERLWRSLKYAVYLHDLEDGFVAQRVIAVDRVLQRATTALGARSHASGDGVAEREEEVA